MPAVGIDLGTTYSCVGIWRNGSVDIIPNGQGNRITPSFVAFSKGERLVGTSAKNQAARNPKNTIYDAKRLIGREFGDSSVQRDIKNFPFTVVRNKVGKPVVEVELKKKGPKQQFTPEQISAFILEDLKKSAETFLGEPVKEAVVTVPAYFNDSQRASTQDAGRIAGLKVLRIINEPTAAAIAYGLNLKKEQRILIFDLGGGTFDVSLLNVDNGVFEVLATAGDTHLGGEDFDNILVDYFAKQFMKETDLDVYESKRALRRLKAECEKLKRTLSQQTQATLEVEALYQGEDLSATMTRARFEDLCSKPFKGCLKPVEQVLIDTGLERKAIDEIVLVGGSTRIPKIRSLISDYFGGKKLNHTISPDEAVAFGAAVQAGVISGVEDSADIVLVDVCPLSLGIEVRGGDMVKIIPKNSAVPCTRNKVFTTYKDDQTSVSIRIFEGERAKTAQNHSLGRFELTGIPPKKRGMCTVNVAFSLDCNNILTVSAKSNSGGAEKELRIENDQNRLTEDQIKEMLEEAERFKEEDERIAKIVEAKNKLENFAFHCRNTGPNLFDEEDKKSVEKAGGDALEWLENEGRKGSLEDVQKAFNDLYESTQEAFEKQKAEEKRIKEEKEAEEKKKEEEAKKQKEGEAQGEKPEKEGCGDGDCEGGECPN